MSGGYLVSALEPILQAIEDEKKGITKTPQNLEYNPSKDGEIEKGALVKVNDPMASAWPKYGRVLELIDDGKYLIQPEKALMSGEYLNKVEGNVLRTRPSQHHPK